MSLETRFTIYMYCHYMYIVRELIGSIDNLMAAFSGISKQI